MKNYRVIYRGNVVDIIEAENFSEAMKIADGRGYSITMVDIIEIK